MSLGLWRTRFDVVPSIKTFNPTTEHMGKGLKRDIWVLAGCWATVLMEHLLHERHGLTDSLLRKEGRTAGPGHQRPRHLRRRGRGLPRLRLRVYGDRLGRARLRRLRPDGPRRDPPRGQLPRRVAARRRPRGIEERLPQLYDLPDDGWLSRAGGHGGAMGEERVVDVCVSVIYVDAGLILAGTPGGIVGLRMVQRLAAVRH